MRNKRGYDGLAQGMHLQNFNKETFLENAHLEDRERDWEQHQHEPY
jgi:hypothetical protein